MTPAQKVIRNSLKLLQLRLDAYVGFSASDRNTAQRGRAAVRMRHEIESLQSRILKSAKAERCADTVNALASITACIVADRFSPTDAVRYSADMRALVARAVGELVSA